LVSIIVVNWNGRRYLVDCLDALLAQDVGPLQIVVVDNGSTDGSTEMIERRYPMVTLARQSRNLGFAAGNNAALPMCDGHFLALVNNDTRAEPTWLGELVDALERWPLAAGACGTIVALDQPSRVTFTTPKIDAVSARAIWVNSPAPLCRVDTLSGCGMLLRREVVDALGLFDEAYVAYYEETDWCARAIRAGHDVLYVPSAVIAHAERGSTSERYHLYHMHRNRLRFALKHFDRALIPGLLARYSLDTVIEAARLVRHGRAWLLPTMVRGLAWNLRHVAATLSARAALSGRRSYSQSLPLRFHRSDGRGGLVPALTA
jgi:GT2 family glycosyltransferase